MKKLALKKTALKKLTPDQLGNVAGAWPSTDPECFAVPTKHRC